MAIRQERLAGIILKEISEMIQFEVKDPNIGFVTVTGVDLTNEIGRASWWATVC